MSDLIERQAAIDALRREYNTDDSDYPTEYQLGLSAGRRIIDELPSAQSGISEKLYLCKCYVTDEEGLQYEVIHTGDIRRITGWEI